MNSIDDIVFALSPKATAFLKNNGGELDIQLTTVMMLIDSITPVAQYTPFLKSFEPIEPKFLELEALGYLIRVGHVSAQAVQTFKDSVAAGGHISTLHSIDAQAPDSGFISLD
jgi:hypothetical protein